MRFSKQPKSHQLSCSLGNGQKRSSPSKRALRRALRRAQRAAQRKAMQEAMPPSVKQEHRDAKRRGAQELRRKRRADQRELTQDRNAARAYKYASRSP